MTGENSEQRSITNFTGETKDIGSPESVQETPPSAENPADFLAWLRKDSTPSPEAAVEQLPELIEQVQTGGYNAWSAGNCINLILTTASTPIDYPELIVVLDSNHVDTPVLLEHLFAIYPREVPTLEDSIDLDALEETLSHADRMEVYRLLSRFPPNDVIYSKLKQVDELFKGVVDLAGTKYPVGGFFHTYAMRCLNTYLQLPDRAPVELAEQAITDKTWSSVRVIAATPKQAVDSGLTDRIIHELEGAKVPPEFYHGRIIQSLCEVYIQTEDSDVQHEVGEIIQAALDAGVYPARWDEIITELIDTIRAGTIDDQGSIILEGILTAVRNEDFDVNIGAVFPVNTVIEELSTDPSVWASPITILAEGWPDLLYEYATDLVTVARNNDGRDRTVICEALASMGEASPSDVLSAIEPLVRDLERARSVQEVNDVGTVLRALKVYPPPPQLKALYGSTNEAIDITAKRIVADLRQKFQESNPALEPGGVDSIQDLSEEYSLVRCTGAVTWESPSLSSSELSIISSTAKIAAAAAQTKGGRDERISAVLGELLDEEIAVEEKDSSIQFIVPSYDSAWVEFAALGAMFAQIVNPDLRVALHTPAINGWGTKKDLREALKQYGIALSVDHGTQITPLFDLVPTARITGGEVVIETSMTTISDDPPFLTLTRDIELLSESPADVILYNYLPGIDAVDAAQLQQWRGGRAESLPAQDSASEGGRALVADGFGGVADQASMINLIQIDDVDPDSISQCHPDNPVHIEIHGIFSVHQAVDRRQHIGPPTDLPLPFLVTERPKSGSSKQNQESVNPRARAADQLTSGPSHVEIHAVQSDIKIGELLAKIDKSADRIGDADAIRALRSLRFTLGSLPIPVDLHDAWVQTQVDQGNKWVPRRLHSRRNGIQTLADEAVLDAEVLDETLITIDTLLDRLAESNPLFEKLLEVLDDAAAEGKQVGILCGKKTYKDMLDLYLRERASDWALGKDLQLLDEDTVRGLVPGEVDWLVTFDPLPPQTAIYYHHPSIDKTIVLGHTDGTLSARLHGVDKKRRPFLPRNVEGDLPELVVTVHGSDIESTDSDRSLTDDLYRTFLSVAAQSRADDSSGGSGSSGAIAKYLVEFEDAQPATMWDAHPVIVRSEEHLVSAGEYVLRSLSRVDNGNEIVLIEPDTKADLWEEFLREGWEESDEAVEAEETFMDAVELWYEAVLNGLEEHSETDNLADGIWDFAREIEPEVTVATGTIVDWARSVYRADSPSDLVFRSGLRIGPRHADGVEAVAKKYGSERMADNWEQVFTRIKTIRTTHRQRGSVFWEWLADRACDGNLLNRPGVSPVTVTRCRKEE